MTPSFPRIRVSGNTGAVQALLERDSVPQLENVRREGPPRFAPIGRLWKQPERFSKC